MSKKQELIARQKEDLRNALVCLLLSLLCLTCGIVLVPSALRTGDLLSPIAGLAGAVFFSLMFLHFFCTWCYFQGYLVNMKEQDPDPPSRLMISAAAFRAFIGKKQNAPSPSGIH